MAVALLEMRGFTREEFHDRHPGGKLGNVLLKVQDVMAKGDDMPIVSPDMPMSEALVIMTEKSLGCLGVIDNAGKLIGVITDGDLRRLIEKYGLEGLEMPVERVMTTAPKTISPTAPAVVALNTMQKYDISVLVVTDGQKPVGMIHLHDILKAGVA